jgi:hypothetical protein
MTEQTKTYSILDRKKQVEEYKDKVYTNKFQGHDIRKRILLSRGDSLTDRDLLNHHRELRIKKLSKLLWTIPFLEYYFLRMNNGPFITIPLTYLLYVAVNSINIRRTEYTYAFAKNSQMQHLDTVLRFNMQKIANVNDRWNWKANATSYSEWLAKNDYK